MHSLSYHEKITDKLRIKIALEALLVCPALQTHNVSTLELRLSVAVYYFMRWAQLCVSDNSLPADAVDVLFTCHKILFVLSFGSESSSA